LTKLEEIARAIYEAGPWGVTSQQAVGGPIYRTKNAWGNADNSYNRDECLRLARAAVEAMREPRVSMCAAMQMITEDPDIGWAASFGAMWTAACDAILNEKSA
jgi:hypothetical protein